MPQKLLPERSARTNAVHRTRTYQPGAMARMGNKLAGKLPRHAGPCRGDRAEARVPHARRMRSDISAIATALPKAAVLVVGRTRRSRRSVPPASQPGICPFGHDPLYFTGRRGADV